MTGLVSCLDIDIGHGQGRLLEESVTDSVLMAISGWRWPGHPGSRMSWWVIVAFFTGLSVSSPCLFMGFIGSIIGVSGFFCELDGYR